MKWDFMRKIKRKCNKELKSYYKKMNILYELFDDYYISDCEDEIFTFIKSMSIHEIEKMFDEIILNFNKHDMSDVIFDLKIFKFIIMIYVQKMRNGEEIEN